MKVRDVIKQLQADGWYLDRIRGSHRQFKHLGKPGYCYGIWQTKC